jgi:hypothetical protein
MKRLTFVFALLVLLNGCQLGPVTHPAPTVAQIGSDLNCTSGDHGFEDGQAGWGFCYPATWQYLERVANPVDAGPTHLDILLSITDVPCVPGTPIAGESPRPVCQTNAGLFGLMVISTYDRAGATDLTGWMQANLKPAPAPGQPIQWGDATEAQQLTDGRRIALTPHHVVVMELRFNKDGLDLESAMSTRLGTWKFLY